MNDLDSLSSDGGGGGSSESGLKPGRALRRPFAPRSQPPPSSARPQEAPPAAAVPPPSRPPAVVPAFGFGGAITRGQITPEEAKADASR